MRSVLALAVAGVAAWALAPAPAGGHDERPLVARPTVLVDRAGQVVGRVLGIDLTGFYVWRRVDGRDFLLRAGPDGLTTATPAGQVAFETLDCTGAPWFLASLQPLTPFFSADAPGPGDVLFVADGPPQLKVLKTVWTPGATPPCQPYLGPLIPVPAALAVLDLGPFQPPYGVR